MPRILKTSWDEGPHFKNRPPKKSPTKVLKAYVSRTQYRNPTPGRTERNGRGALRSVLDVPVRRQVK